MANTLPKESLRALLSEIVDYAGLFPPSQLSMDEAVANYAKYKKGNYSWMLGRFIVPLVRLEEFADSAKKFFSGDAEVWKLSVPASEDIYGTVSEIEDFNRESAPFAVCDALEVKAETGARMEQIAESVPPHLNTYFEIPIGENFADLITTIAICGQRAKIRTGGVTPDAFPPAGRITRFMRTCLAANVPFKATAGLHHPLRCEKPLTYEKHASVGAMHGFLNVFLAAAFLLRGFKPDALRELMEDTRADNFQFEDEGVFWREEHFVSTPHLKILRAKNLISFGSCSFDEPIEDLREIGFL
ncbi:MAG TPA: hypothetical protein VNI84_14955 [Pyrinomonadaceae bacterium]|nr:hypothetical protein [Pyrinomonadaceae bacterium]